MSYMKNNDKFKRIIIAVIVAVYIINPVDFPGPIDDIIVTIIGAALEAAISRNKISKSDEKDDDE